MEQKKKSVVTGVIVSVVLFLVYLLFVAVDGGLCLGLSRFELERNESIMLCILLSGLPAFAAALLARFGKTTPACLLVSICGLFAAFCGCCERPSLYDFYAVPNRYSLMVLVVASVVAVLTLWRRRSGARARVGQYLLLVLVVLCAAGSIVMSMYHVKSMRLEFFGGIFWRGAFEKAGQQGITHALRIFSKWLGSGVWLEGVPDCGLAYFPLSNALVLLLMWWSVISARIGKPKPEEARQTGESEVKEI